MDFFRLKIRGLRRLRSGCLFGNINFKDLLVDVNTGCLRPTEIFDMDDVTKYPYEMDWSTYISNMKYF